MEISLDKALKVLELKYDYTEEKLKKSYRSLMKRVHPDVSNADTEEFAKEVNACYEYLWKELKKKLEREKNPGEREERIKRKIFEGGVNYLKKEIAKYLEQYKGYNSIEGLCNGYLDKLTKIKNQEALDKLTLEFNEKIKEVVQKIKEQEEQKYKVRRKNLKNYFVYKNFEFSISSDKDSIRGVELLRKVLEFIYSTPGDELEKMLPILSQIEFEDLDHDFKILDKLIKDYQIYIDIYSGKMYFGAIDGDYLEMKQVEGHDEFTIRFNEVARNFISLKDFFNNAHFAGDRVAYQVENGKIDNANFGTNECLYYLNDLILKREKIYYLGEESADRFYFVSTLGKCYHYEFRGYKDNIENEKYRYKKTCMDAIYSYAETVSSHKEKGRTF